MDWITFAIGFVLGAACIIMGVTAALIYESATKPPQVLWEVFDKDGHPI